jgi:hypothetical protein
MADDTIASYQAPPQHEVSIDVEFVAAPNIDRAMRRAAALMRPTPPTIRMARWPNELGDAPADAIGKTFILSWDGAGNETYRVDHVDGESLVLALA